MRRILSFALLVMAQMSYASASDGLQEINDGLILSPKVFVLNEANLVKPFDFQPSKLNNTVIASLSWTDSTGDKHAKIEIINITYNGDKTSFIFETKQWLPYTLSGEVVSLPVVLKNAKIEFL